MDTYACFKKKFSFQVREGKPVFKNNETKKVSKLDKLVWKILTENALKLEDKYYAIGKVFSFDGTLSMKDASSYENIGYYHNNNKSLILHNNICYIEVYKNYDNFINADCIEATTLESVVSCINVSPTKQYKKLCIIELPSGTHVFYYKDNKVMYDVTEDVEQYLDMYVDKPTKTFAINTERVPPTFTQAPITKSSSSNSTEYVTIYDLIKIHEAHIKFHTSIIEDLKKRI
jgi:hypothetical protein